MQILPPYFILPLDILTYYYFLLAIYLPEDLLLVLVPIKENQTPPPVSDTLVDPKLSQK